MTIPEILSQLERCTGVLPREALEEAVRQREEITPELLRILEWTTGNLPEVAENEDYMAHTYAMLLLAQFREPRAYPVIVNLFSVGDQDLLDGVMGDFITEDLDRVLASVCNGDTSLIEQMAENASLGQYVRAGALGAWEVLFIEGARSRDEVMAYFKSLFHGKLRREPDYIWDILVWHCSDLYPGEVMPEIEQAFADGLVDPFTIDMEGVQKRLTAGKDATLARLMKNPRAVYVRDAAEELAHWVCFREPQSFRLPEPTPESAPAPVRTGPKIGRNEPCPCGSGKKYKKCCGR